MKMPAVFIGHGSPMNALAKNDYTRALEAFGKSLPLPQAIAVISAHWETQGSMIEVGALPKTIHDFYGFPQPLFDFQYPAAGAPALATKVANSLGVKTTSEWGLDHGAWSVLHHLYPAHDIPVFQISLDRGKSFAQHFELGKKLSEWREQGVMILGSGNIVHNLRTIQWDENAPVTPFASQFDLAIKNFILEKNCPGLLEFAGIEPSMIKMALPSFEHYLPLLYVLGAACEGDRLWPAPTFIYEGIQNATISMTSLLF